MKTLDRSIYRGLLLVGFVLPTVGIVFAVLQQWSAAAICAGFWMIGVVALIHAQTRLLNAGARYFRDSLLKQGASAVPDRDLHARIERISEDIAVLRARSRVEPEHDDARGDLVRLAHALRREVRLLQYSVAIADDTQSSNATHSPSA